MNSLPTITIGTSNWLQEPLEGFPHSSKFVVVAMASAFSSIDLQIYFETLRYSEIEKT